MLAALVFPIVTNGNTQLPKVARRISDEATPASREDCLSRCINNADHSKIWDNNTILLSGYVLCDMLYLDRIQGTGLDTVPASHAHVLEDYWWFKDAIDLFHHFPGTGRCCSAKAFVRIAFPWIAAFKIHKSE